MKLYTYEEFLNERLIDDEIPQLQILMRGTIGLTSKTEDFTRDMMNTIYEKYVHLVLVKYKGEFDRRKEAGRNRRYNQLRHDIPLLNFTSADHEGFSKMKAKIYNKVDDLQLSSDKIKFYKTYDGVDFVPKTVYSLDDIENLKLPIIAKPTSGHSAEGIEKFDSYEAARKSKLKFDVWQEAKDIDREFRAFVMDGKVIHIAERITNTSNDKSVGKKDPEEKIDLIYIDQVVEGFPHLDRINQIMKELNKECKLEFYNIDLILDKSGELWVPEINGAPGIGPAMFATIYKAWVDMAYDTKLSEDTIAELDEMAKEHRSLMKKTYPKEYDSSLKPVKVD